MYKNVLIAYNMILCFIRRYMARWKVKVNIKCTLVQAVRTIGRVEVYLYSFLVTVLEGVMGQRHAPATFYPREGPGTHCTGVWLGSRAGVDSCRKFRPHPPGFDPRTVHPVTSRYTNWATRGKWQCMFIRVVFAWPLFQSKSNKNYKFLHRVCYP